MNRTIIAILLLAGALLQGCKQEVYQWRGTHRDGVFQESDLLDSWPEEGPGVEWRQPVGGTFAQLAVMGDAVFTATSDEEKEYIVSLYRQNGKERWRAEIGEVFEDQFGRGPRATPTIAGTESAAAASLDRRRRSPCT